VAGSHFYFGRRGGQNHEKAEWFSTEGRKGSEGDEIRWVAAGVKPDLGERFNELAVRGEYAGRTAGSESSRNGT
jgi:hypothetical protein